MFAEGDRVTVMPHPQSMRYKRIPATVAGMVGDSVVVVVYDRSAAWSDMPPNADVVHVDRCEYATATA